MENVLELPWVIIETSLDITDGTMFDVRVKATTTVARESVNTVCRWAQHCLGRLGGRLDLDSFLGAMDFLERNSFILLKYEYLLSNIQAQVLWENPYVIISNTKSSSAIF